MDRYDFSASCLTSSFVSQVCFSLSDELIALDAVGENDASLEVPKDHPFTMHPVDGQTMAVFSHSNTGQSKPAVPALVSVLLSCRIMKPSGSCLVAGSRVQTEIDRQCM